MTMENVEEIWVTVQGWVMQFGFKMFAALVILVLGRIVAGWLSALLERLMTRSKVDATLVQFTGRLVYTALLTFVILAALGQLDIETTSFVAVIGAAGFAIGLAFKDSLGNLSSGAMLIMFRPFKIGDFVEAAGVKGKIERIDIFSTRMRSSDNALIIIPNGQITSKVITNFTSISTRRIDLVIGISYDDDIDKAKSIIKSILDKNDKVLLDPEPLIAVGELGESSIDIFVRPWVKTPDYWPTKYSILETVKKEFDANGVSIPFPQRDVHLIHAQKS